MSENPQGITGIVLTDALQINWTRTSLNRHAGNSWIETEQLAQVSSNFWQCALNLQKLPDVD